MSLWDAFRDLFGNVEEDEDPGQYSEPRFGPPVGLERAMKLLYEFGLERIASDVECLARPTVLIEPCPEDRSAVGASRIGGLPDVPDGFAWPRSEAGPLAHIAQFRLSEVAPHDAEHLLPTEGMLYLFFDAVEQPGGFDPGHREGACVQYHPTEDELAAATPPDDLDDAARFEPVPIRFASAVTFPTCQAILEHDHLAFADDEEMDCYLQWLAEVGQAGEARYSWLLGWPDEIRGDMQSECAMVTAGIYCGEGQPSDAPGAEGARPEAAEWRLLAQIHSLDDARMMWGDSGMLYWWMRLEDVRRRSFERVWAIMQCF